MNKIHYALIAVATLVIGWLLFSQSNIALSGAGCNSGNCTDFDAVNTIKGFWIADVATIDLNGNLPKTSIGFGSTTIATARATSVTGSTTVCYQQFSTVATSTLNFAVADFAISSTTASGVTLAKSSGTSASSTVIQTWALAANAKGTLRPVATTTTAGIANLTLAPSDYLVWTMQGGVGTFSPSVKCDAQAVVSI